MPGLLLVGSGGRGEDVRRVPGAVGGAEGPEGEEAPCRSRGRGGPRVARDEEQAPSQVLGSSGGGLPRGEAGDRDPDPERRDQGQDGEDLVRRPLPREVASVLLVRRVVHGVPAFSHEVDSRADRASGFGLLLDHDLGPGVRERRDLDREPDDGGFLLLSFSRFRPVRLRWHATTALGKHTHARTRGARLQVQEGEAKNETIR